METTDRDHPTYPTPAKEPNMPKTTSAARRPPRVKPVKPRRGQPTPPLPNVCNESGEVDLLDSADLDARARQALSLGAPLDIFDWTPVVTDEVRQSNLDALLKWEANLERKREARQHNRNGYTPDENRKRHIALTILANVERKLSEAAEGERDTATCNAIYDLGKFVNEDCLSQAEVSQAIERAAKSNGLAEDRSNGGLTKIKRDVPRRLTKAHRDGTTVDWTRFDWLYDDERHDARAGDSSESGKDTADEFDENETPRLATGLLTRTDLLALPNPEPLIDNVLDQGTTALLYGRWGTLKTFIALDWAASVATGRQWQGRTTIERRVLYIVGEGAWGFKGRVQSWETGWQQTIADDSFSVMPMPVNLLKASEVAELAALITWGRYGLVILDTLARCMVGGEENSAKDSGVVVDSMTRLRDATPGGRGVVIGVHHAGKDTKTLRGSSAFEAGVDTVYFTSRDEQVVTLTREKRKDGPESDVHLLEFDSIPGTLSGTLRMSHGMSHDAETGERAATLRLIMSQHFSLTGASAAELRRLVVDDGPLTRATFYRALSDLLKEGWLTNTGSDKRPFYRIATAN